MGPKDPRRLGMGRRGSVLILDHSMAAITNISGYEHALAATEYLLRQVGERHWADWLHEDMLAWRANGDVSHHRSAYGGMGSFNDVIICRMNQHNVTAEQEPWANALFEWLKAILFQLSREPSMVPTIDVLRGTVGRHAPSLSAFVGGEHAPTSMHGLVGESWKITGVRCLACGYAEVTRSGIDSAIADDIVPELVFDGCARGALIQVVDRVLAQDLDGLADRRAKLIFAATASGLQIRNDDGWMRPCPRCNADDTAVYRWVYHEGPPPQLEVASDNLPLRNATPSVQACDDPLPKRAGSIWANIRRLLGCTS